MTPETITKVKMLPAGVKTLSVHMYTFCPPLGAEIYLV